MNRETLKDIEREVMKFTGCFNKDKVLWAYNRLTVEELTNEVAIKIIRSTNEVNKSYIRKAVMFTCIDIYRKMSDYDESYSEQCEPEDDGGLEFQERLMTLKIFEPRELKIVLLMLEGKRNPEIRKELGIPKMTYYSILKRLRVKYTDMLEQPEQS